MEKKTLRLSVEDFSHQDDGAELRNFIVTEGYKFPSSFTYNQPNILDGVAFCICMSGSAKIKINSKICYIDPTTILTVLPNHIVEPLERSNDLVLRMLVFSLDMVFDLHLQVEAIQAIGRTPCVKVSEQDKNILLNMHRLIIKLYDQKNYSQRQTIAKSMLYTLILQIEAIYNSADPQPLTVGSARTEELTDQFLKMLIVHYKQQRSPSFYADKLCVSTKYLSQIVKKVTGETVFEWINKIVILGAKNMLKTSDCSVLQVSEVLNFPNPSFFCRFFKKHSGMTPLEFKKS